MVHSALWATYLYEQPETMDQELRRRRLPAMTLTAVTLTRILERARDDIPAPLLGIALWNLLAFYRRQRPTRRFVKLLRDVLGLGLDEARHIHREQPHAAFPPYPDLAILNPSLDFDESSDPPRWASLQMCVPTEFESLESLIKPSQWHARCNLFWPQLERTRHDSETFTGALRLPGDARGEPLPVTLLRVENTCNQLEARARFRIVRNEGSILCNTALDVKKEPGRPGVTRIELQREILSPETLPRATLSYW